MEKKIVLALFLSAFLAQGKASNVAGTAHPMTSAPSLASVAQPVDLTTAAEVATQSVVYIKVSSTSRQTQMQEIDPFSDFFGDFFGRGQRSPQQRQAPKRSGAGSGVILSADGYIVTNNHVVEDADEILVKLNDNREYKGRIIGLDKSTDLALLKIEAKDLNP